LTDWQQELIFRLNNKINPFINCVEIRYFVPYTVKRKDSCTHFYEVPLIWAWPSQTGAPPVGGLVLLHLSRHLSQMNTVTIRANMAESESLETITEHERILQEIESTDTACVGPTLRWEMCKIRSYLRFRWWCDVFSCLMDGKQAFVC